MSACGRACCIVMKSAHAVQGLSFDVKGFPARSDAKMQNGVGLERFIQLAQTPGNNVVDDWKDAKLDFNPKPGEPGLALVERTDQQGRRIFRDAWKAAEASDENANGLSRHDASYRGGEGLR